MPSNLIIPLMLAAMAVFMFMSIRNQKKRAAAASEMQSSVVPGSRVQLHSGLFGTVVDPSGEEFVTIEIAPGVVTEWNRLAIREVITADEDGADAADSDDEDPIEVPDSPAALDKLTKKTDDESGDKPEEK
ncbi:preprotein translocase subunit YajC [Gordonia sp. PDNC005]|uniref:preprotein translocase subunit YajC n=1 Tax=unclassified Gordonia (in: high G+C Gram-positive bacteria) TaxID=2657482 RepID=UPI001965F635|nr:preprotein translocase subunit YajC [Gordonia sp. PDNC005]QRY64000.1 preprotein translocase subunit YajC [Gordonia sp. PDNC005]